MICPNCGAQLPDTVRMCYSCRVQFNSNRTGFYVEQPTITSNQYAYNAKKSDIVKIYTIISIVGILCIFLGTFVPFFQTSSILNNYSWRLFDGNGNQWGTWIICIILSAYSIPGVKYTKSDAIGKVLAGILGIGLTAYNVYDVIKWFNQSYSGKSVDLSLKGGFYLLIIGYAVVLVSGILLYPHALTKQEKIYAKRNA